MCLRNIISRTNEIWRHGNAQATFSYRTESLSEGLRAVWRRLGGSGSAFHAPPPALSQFSLPDDEPPTPTSARRRAQAILTTTVSNCSHSFDPFLYLTVAICYTNHPLNLQATDEIDKNVTRTCILDHARRISTIDNFTRPPALRHRLPILIISPIRACSSAADVLDPATESCAQHEIVTMLVAPSRPWLNLRYSSLFRLCP